MKLTNSQQVAYNLLINALPGGIKNYEFPQNHCLCYRKRISELRKMGFNIELKKVKGNVNEYKLIKMQVDKEGQIIMPMFNRV